VAQLSFWVWLSAKPGLSARKIARLVEEFGSAGEIYRADRARLTSVGELTPEDLSLLEDKNLSAAQAVLEDCAALDLQIITLQDAAYPERLRHIPDPPAVLYVKGRLPALDLYPAVAVVGTRRPSAYGYFTAKKAGFQLASGGAIVVSGMAAGCDGAAAKGALLASKPTVAVLGGGVDVCYPEENRPLYEEIAKQGALISECPPRTSITKQSFPRRNRIISGLCHAVVVAEAPERSGALITAEHALSQGRDVFAVPSNLDSPTGRGCNRLIQQGAQLYMSGSDVLANLSPQFGNRLDLVAAEAEPPRETAKAAQKNRQAQEKALFATDDPLQQTICDLLKENGPMALDDLLEEVAHLQKTEPELLTAEITSALTLLELAGTVTQRPGKIFGL
jgi:DNA processing protein